MAHQGDASPTSSFDHLLAEDRGDRRGLRLGLLVAVVAHLAVFAITWPTLATDATVVADPPAKIYRLPIARFQLSPALSYEPTRAPRKWISIPEPSGGCGAPPVRPKPAALKVARKRKTIVDANSLAEPPEAIVRVAPQYPEAARRARIQGAVVLQLIIDPSGRVDSVSVLRGFPLGPTESAIEAVRQWEFEPCTFNGRPVSVRFNLTINFRLE